jgi:hypothetical protein
VIARLHLVTLVKGVLQRFGNRLVPLLCEFRTVVIEHVPIMLSLKEKSDANDDDWHVGKTSTCSENCLSVTHLPVSKSHGAVRKSPNS